VAAAAAKAYAADAAVGVCEAAIQVHGGIGFTWEHVLHRLYKRALGIQSFAASGTRLRAEIAAALLNGRDESEPGVAVAAAPVEQGG
jgi:alkylation response protein AidB-like acyl-CoA dehydrogenase